VFGAIDVGVMIHGRFQTGSFAPWWAGENRLSAMPVSSTIPA
jgi:hypothetical protein